MVLLSKNLVSYRSENNIVDWIIKITVQRIAQTETLKLFIALFVLSFLHNYFDGLKLFLGLYSA